MESLYQETKEELERSKGQYSSTVQELRTSMAEMEKKYSEKEREEEDTVMAMLRKEKELLLLLEKIKTENKALSDQQEALSVYYSNLQLKLDEKTMSNRQNDTREEEQYRYSSNSVAVQPSFGISDADNALDDDNFFRLQDKLAQMHHTVSTMLRMEEPTGIVDNGTHSNLPSSMCEESIRIKLTKLREMASVLMAEQKNNHVVGDSIIPDQIVSTDVLPGCVPEEYRMADVCVQETVPIETENIASEELSDKRMEEVPIETENIPSEELSDKRMEEERPPTTSSNEPKESKAEENAQLRKEPLGLPVPMGREYLSTALERHESFQRHKEKLRIFAEAQFMWKNNVNVESEDFAKVNVNVNEESIEIVRKATNRIN